MQRLLVFLRNGNICKCIIALVAEHCSSLYTALQITKKGLETGGLFWLDCDAYCIFDLPAMHSALYGTAFQGSKTKMGRCFQVKCKVMHSENEELGSKGNVC